MRKSFCGLSMLMLTCTLTIAGTMNVQAGEINANEARLVSAASGTFTYEGKTYHASSQYIGELRAYLSKDDVDLTAADVSSLISDMNANIPAGVKEGYLVPDVEETEEDESGEEVSGEDTSDDEASDEIGEASDETGETEDQTEEADAAPSEPEPPAYTVEETPQETQIKDAEGSVIFTAAPMIKAVGYHKQTARSFGVLAVLALTAILGGLFLVIRHEKA
ncbi:MAG: hypothetical protein MSA09_11535 [Lachnospiraceae bacterium]|nr:hypothetical protein [Lachnospiraceae bacterium]